MENPNILCIETTGEICSVALIRGAECVAVKESNTHNSHAKNMIPFIQEVLQMAEMDKSQLSAVAVSIGPGSYTGLRIGVSTAKGLAFSLNIPVIAVPTLESIAQPYLGQGARVRPMMDARRMEVFTALYSSDGQQLEKAEAKIVENATFKDELTNFKTIFCGNGAPKCREILEKFENAIVENAALSAKNMAKIVYRKYQNKDFEDVAYFEPFYLKDYVAGKPNVKGLHS